MRADVYNTIPHEKEKAAFLVVFDKKRRKSEKRRGAHSRSACER
jgi:hypothetical protein